MRKRNHIFMNVRATQNHTFMNVPLDKNHTFMNEGLKYGKQSKSHQTGSLYTKFGRKSVKKHQKFGRKNVLFSCKFGRKSVTLRTKRLGINNLCIEASSIS